MTPDATKGLQPLAWLDYKQEAIQALGIPPDVTEACGIGHASRGMMRRRITIGIRTPTGELLAYCGVGDGTLKLPTTFRLQPAQCGSLF